MPIISFSVRFNRPELIVILHRLRDRMCSRINEVDWSSLLDAYGPATEVPSWLRQLASESADERQDAIDALFGLIWHQGTIYTSSVAALPILAEFLEDEEQGHRDNIAGLIASIATGSCWYHGSSMWPIIVRDFEEEKLRRQGSSIAEQRAIERPVMEAARAFGSDILPALLPFLCSEDPEVRQMIANAAASFPNRAREHSAILRSAMERESEEWVRDVLVSALESVTERG